MASENIKKYAFVISLDHNYILPVQALLNSIIKFNMTDYADIILLYKNIDPSIFVTDTFKPICIQSEIVPEDRYLQMHKFADKYDSLCLLDGDMMFLADVKRFFEIASCGFIIGCNDDTAFNRKNIKDANNNIIIKNVDFYGVLCNVPFFFNYKHTESIWQLFTKLYEKSKGICDYDLFNYALSLNPEITEKLITYPSVCFTGVHYTYLKYQTMFLFDLFRENMTENQGKDCVCEKDFVVTRDWMRVYSIHGKFFQLYWETAHERYMIPYYAHEHGTNKEKLKFFLEYCNKVTQRLHRIFAENVHNGDIPLLNIYNHLQESHQVQTENLKKYFVKK